MQLILLYIYKFQIIIEIIYKKLEYLFYNIKLYFLVFYFISYLNIELYNLRYKKLIK